MVTCDQFIYTSEKTKEREGYQVIAKTKGITEDIVENLTGYLYPVGVDLDNFTESHSLRILDNDKVAYSIVKNIGIGYDTRKGTLYNHTFVIDKADFKKLDYDSRIFYNHFIKDTSLRGEMEKIRIEPIKIQTNFDVIGTLGRPAIGLLLRFLFLNKKVALLETSQIDLMQNILATLPPSMRLISFSTNVPQPDRQSEYDLIQTPKNMIYKLDKTWKIVDPSESRQISDYARKGSTNKDFEYLAHLILNKDKKKLLKIHDTFEKLRGEGATNKIQFLIHKDLHDSTNDIKKKGEESYECATIAQNFDFDLSSKFLEKAKKYSVEIKSEELFSKIRTGELALQVKREPLGLRMIEMVLENVNEKDPEVRNVFLNKIIKMKRSEFREKGYHLLNEVLTSNSYYKEEILRLFVENKFLNSYPIQFIVNSQKERKQNTYAVIRTFATIASLYNFQFLKKLFRILKINLDNINELNKFQQIIYDTFSNPSIREKASSSLIVEISKNLRLKMEGELNKKVVKTSSGTLKWNSKKEFEDIKHSSHDILHNMSSLLEFILHYRKQRLTPTLKSQIIEEINSIKSITKKIHSIEYSKPVLETQIPVWLDMWLRFWHLK